MNARMSYLVCYYSRAVNCIVGSVVAVRTFRITKKRYLNDKVSSERKTVLITGCDTGFGHLLAKHLDSKGFSVIACCLFPNDNGAKELQKSCSERLKVVGLDVTKDESVSQAKEFVTKNLEDSELWAIVNNAGILKGVTIELTSLRDFKDSLEVNTLGVVRVTQAFLPLLRKSKGRVVNLTSVAGKCQLSTN
ncbi:Estradiol 17-beta-dehydrogenase 2 [Araneus ventricosus]|uniref:Estradiol 17-beta-dehydrogenase 2 n=1 Tax=Araneus ventricosus TaxID=182803 RepID=A0A4Y2B440_ARAVE|nr:Estradiol 17-beta-dehydrogenase 2 [Araneus ventricosus]